MGRLRNIKILAIILGVIFLTGGLFTMGSKAAEGEDKNVLRIGVFEEIESLNPLVAYSAPAYEVMRLNYNLLISWDQDLNPVPDLAKSWEMSEDGKQWTFHLQEGVKWQDGQPFTAADVKFTFEYIRDNQIGYFNDYVSNMSDIQTPDENTVVITLNRAYSWMPQVWVPILPKHIWEKIDPAEASSTFANDAPVGTGPFKVIEYKKGEYTRMAVNTDYFKGAPKIDEVVFNIYANESTAVEALKLDEVDLLTKMSAATFKSLEGQENINAVASESSRFSEMAINCWTDSKSKGNPLLRDKNIRKAIAQSIDKQYLIDAVYFGKGTPGDALVPPMYKYWHYEPAAGEMYTFNLENAKKTLDEAGYTDQNGDGVRESADGKALDFRLTLRSEATEQQKMGRIIAEWLKQVGIKITIDVVDSGTLTDRIYADADYDLFIWNYYMDVDPTSILKIMTTGQITSWNDSYYSNPKYDQLFEEQDKEMDKGKRQSIINEMQKIIYADQPYVILVYGPELEAYRTDRFEGWVRTPANGPLIITQNMDTYENLKPISQKTAPAEQNQDSKKGSAWIWIILLIMAAIGAGLGIKKRKSSI